MTRRTLINMYGRLRFDRRSLSWKGPKREAVNAGYGAQDSQWLHRITQYGEKVHDIEVCYLNSRAAQGPVEGKNRKYGTARGASAQGRWDDSESAPDWGSSPRWVSVLWVLTRIETAYGSTTALSAGSSRTHQRNNSVRPLYYT